MLLTALLPQGRISASVWREQASETHESSILWRPCSARSPDSHLPPCGVAGLGDCCFPRRDAHRGIELVCFVLLKRLGVAAFKIIQGKTKFGLCPVFYTLKSVIFFLQGQSCLGTVCLHWSLVMLHGTALLAAEVRMLPLCCGEGGVQNSRGYPTLESTISQLSRPP